MRARTTSRFVPAIIHLGNREKTDECSRGDCANPRFWRSVAVTYSRKRTRCSLLNAHRISPQHDVRSHRGNPNDGSYAPPNLKGFHSIGTAWISPREEHVIRTRFSDRRVGDLWRKLPVNHRKPQFGQGHFTDASSGPNHISSLATARKVHFRQCAFDPEALNGHEVLDSETTINGPAHLGQTARHLREGG
jgi:hypothetical protein